MLESQFPNSGFGVSPRLFFVQYAMLASKCVPSCRRSVALIHTQSLYLLNRSTYQLAPLFLLELEFHLDYFQHPKLASKRLPNFRRSFVFMRHPQQSKNQPLFIYKIKFKQQLATLKLMQYYFLGYVGTIYIRCISWNHS